MMFLWAEYLLDYYLPMAETAPTEASIYSIAIVQRDELRFSKRRPICVQLCIAYSQKKTVKDVRYCHETVQFGSAFED